MYMYYYASSYLKKKQNNWRRTRYIVDFYEIDFQNTYDDNEEENEEFKDVTECKIQPRRRVLKHEDSHLQWVIKAV